jgi:hypothetical protein
MGGLIFFAESAALVLNQHGSKSEKRCQEILGYNSA